jgi:hypothetical protein
MASYLKWDSRMTKRAEVNVLLFFHNIATWQHKSGARHANFLCSLRKNSIQAKNIVIKKAVAAPPAAESVPADQRQFLWVSLWKESGINACEQFRSGAGLRMVQSKKLDLKHRNLINKPSSTIAAPLARVPCLD